jgi:hypothetical protein
VIDILDNADTLDGCHGAYTYGLARRRLGDYGLRTAVESGELVGFGRGVLIDARRVFDLRTRCAGALLLTGGVLIGPTAAALHGCSAVGGYPVHVRIPYVRRIRSRPGLMVHQGWLTSDDVMVMDHLRVLTPEAAVAEVLCMTAKRTGLACVDEMLRPLRPSDRPDFIHSVEARLAARADRRGTKQAAQLLGLASGLPACPAESAFLFVLVGAGFSRPVCQYEGVAFAWPEARVALAYGESSKDSALRHRGWAVVRADDLDLAEPTGLLRRLREAFRMPRAA